MKHLPIAVDVRDLDIATSPFFGGEFAVYLTKVAALLVGEVDLVDSANGAYTANSGATIKAGGCDLQMGASTYLKSDVDCVVTLNVKDENNIARTCSFTFTAPDRAANQSSDFERGYATDGILSGGTKVTEIVGLASIVGGYRNVQFSVYQLPEAADYNLVGCTTAKKFSTKSRKAVGINCGMKSDAFVKRGMEEPGELTIDAKFRGMAENLVRYSGAKCTAMLIGIKDGQVTTDRIIFTQYTPTVSVDLPDGEGEAMENAATGKFVEPLFFVAP